MFRFSLIVSASFFLRCASSIFWERVSSFCFILFSACATLLFFSFITFSCSALSCKNLSLACRIFSFLITSASVSASLIIFRLLFLSAECQKNIPAPNPASSATAPRIIARILFIDVINIVIEIIVNILKKTRKVPSDFIKPHIYMVEAPIPG